MDKYNNLVEPYSAHSYGKYYNFNQRFRWPTSFPWDFCICSINISQPRKIFILVLVNSICQSFRVSVYKNSLTFWVSESERGDKGTINIRERETRMVRTIVWQAAMGCTRTEECWGDSQGIDNFRPTTCTSAWRWMFDSTWHLPVLLSTIHY